MECIRRALALTVLLATAARADKTEDAIAGFQNQARAQSRTAEAPPADVLMGDAEEKALKREWADALAAMQSTAASAKFLRENRLPILIVYADERPSLSPRALAEYDDGKLYVNALNLELIRMDLQHQGAGENIARTLAHKTAHILAHEIRHAITAAEVRAEVGEEFPVALIENEMLSFHDQVLAQEESARLWPEDARYASAGFEKREAELAQAWRDGGLDGAQKYVCGVYGRRAASILASTNAELAARYAHGLETAAEADAGETPGASAALGRLRAKAHEAAAFSANSRQMDLLRAYYARRYRELGSSSASGCPVTRNP